MKITHEIKQQMLELKNQNKNFEEIAKIIGCSKKTVRYHLGENTKKLTVKANNNRRRQRIIDIKILKGGKCEICGYNNCFDALEFHHLNPEEKEFGIAKQRGAPIKKLAKEINKCIMICVNCHREIHEKITDVSQFIESVKIITDQDIDDFIFMRNERGKILSITNKPVRPKTLYYCECGKQKEKRSLNCSTCMGLNKTIEIPISKDELSKLVWTKPVSDLAKDFGVCKMTVEKWCKNLQIVKPGRGYWNGKTYNKK